MAAITPMTRSADHPSRWKWFLGLGIVLLALGLASAGASTLLELTSLLLFGPLLLVSSLLQLLTASFAEKGKECVLHLAAAGLELILGGLIMAHPLPVVTDLVVVVAVLLIAVGLVRLARSLVMHSPGRVWASLAGVAAIVLGVCVWLKVPVSGLWFVGLCLALDFLCHGASWSVLAFAERNLSAAQAPLQTT
jgi:uncharacterized membrane protein HdeD (DUF308 family)